MRQITPEWVPGALWLLGALGVTAAFYFLDKNAHTALWIGLASVVAILLGVAFYIRNGLIEKEIRREVFFLKAHVVVVFGHPSVFLYRYRASSGSGLRLAPVGLMMTVELTPKTSVASKLSSYIVDLEHDGRWVRLYNLRPDDLDAFFSVSPSMNLKTAVQWDFRERSFDAMARDRPAPISGWVFFEWPPELRRRVNQVKKLRFTLKDTVGHEQVAIVDSPLPEEGEPGASYLGSSTMRRGEVRDISGIPIEPKMDYEANAAARRTPAPRPSPPDDKR